MTNIIYNYDLWNYLYNKNICIKYTNNIDHKNKKLIWNYPLWYPINYKMNNIEELKNILLEFKKKYNKYFIKIIINEDTIEECWFNFPTYF